jgi:phosphopantetheinyl transferase
LNTQPFQLLKNTIVLEEILEEREAFLSAEDKDILFFKIWTLKEAYLKYTGVGIRGLGGITVYPLGEGIKTNARCSFTLIGGMPGYQAAVCDKEGGVSVEHVQSDALYTV